jgi:predicted Zn-dependent peptidase
VNQYLNAQYVPSNMVLSVAGNIDEEAIIATARRWLGDMPDKTPGAWYPFVADGKTCRVAVREKATEQAHVCIAYPAVSLDHPDRFAVDLVSTILGEGMSSRLFLDLREERALVYDIHSYPSEYRDAGALTIYAGCDPENARVTLEAALEQVAKLGPTLPADEIAKAKQMARGRMQLRMEDTRSVAGWQGSQELLLGEVLTVDEVVARIDAVTPDDLQRVIRDLLQPAKAVLAAVGPFEDESAFAGLI